MNNIDILEDYIELIEKGYCEDCNELCNISTAPSYPSKAVAQAISTLIAENKELKEENFNLKQQKIIDKCSIPSQDNFYDYYNYIEKSKVEEEIDGKFKEAKGLYERGVQPQAQYTMKLLRDLEQSLLGKE